MNYEFILFYRLRLLNDTGFIEPKLYKSLLNDCEELLSIIVSIQVTLKKKSNS